MHVHLLIDTQPMFNDHPNVATHNTKQSKQSPRTYYSAMGLDFNKHRSDKSGSPEASTFHPLDVHVIHQVCAYVRT